MFKKKISLAILGSTGSIGRTSCNIIKKNLKNFKVDLLCCNKNYKIILKQIKMFLPKFVIVSDSKTYHRLKKKKFKKKIIFFQNLEEFEKINKKKFDKVILSISSINGLKYAFSFIQYSKEILLANKETIVCGGKLFLNKAKKYKCNIKSIDSEHFCISQTLKNKKNHAVSKVYLTASGGPFLNKKKKYLKKISIEKALNHPHWTMGKKISIDSATMVNKVFELIEASILFDLPPNKIKIKIHKEAKVHSVVVFKNGIVELLAHNTSMEIPIYNSLLNDKKFVNKNNFFYNKKLINFSFDEISLRQFPIIKTGYKMIKYGPRACILFNVINDRLVELFLSEKIFFYQIVSKLNKIVNCKKYIKYFKKKVTKVNDIYETINFANKIFL